MRVQVDTHKPGGRDGKVGGRDGKVGGRDGKPELTTVINSDRLAAPIHRHGHRRRAQVVIAFRGTESLRDWRTDVTALLQTVVPDPETGTLRTLGDVGRSARGRASTSDR